MEDTFKLNIDYYTNNKSIDFFQKIFEMRKEKADILRVQTKKENCERYCQLFDTCQKKEKYQHNRTYCDDFIHINDKPVEVENDE